MYLMVIIKMLTNYIKEFIAISEYLVKNGYKKTLNFVIISKKDLEPLLDKNKFDTSQKKLQIWKGLNWIDTEDGRVTKRIYSKEEGKYIPSVKIRLQVYETLRSLM